MKSLNCKQFKQLTIDFLYDYESIPDLEKAAFHEHLKTCSQCAMEYEEMTALLNVMNQRHVPEMDEDYWDSYSAKLQEKLAHADEKENLIPLIKHYTGWRRALYPVAALFLLLVGIGIGRFLYLPSPSAHNLKNNLPTETVAQRQDIGPSLQEHFENLRPLLIDYANYSETDPKNNSDEYILVDKKILKKLAFQNYILKKIAERENNSDLKHLLEELELILLEVSNMDSLEKTEGNPQKDTLKRVSGILKESDLLFKMEIYNKQRNTHQLSTNI